MLDSTQTTATKKSSLYRRIIGLSNKRKSSTNVDMAGRSEEVNKLISSILQNYFRQFIELQTEFASSPDDKDLARTNALTGLRDMFDDSVKKYLNEDLLLDGTIAIMNQIYRAAPQEIDFPDLIQM